VACSGDVQALATRRARRMRAQRFPCRGLLCLRIADQPQRSAQRGGNEVSVDCLYKPRQSIVAHRQFW
jgi:hypothetical protein